MTDELIAQSDLRAKALMAEHMERVRQFIGPLHPDEPIPVELQTEFKLGPDFDPDYFDKLDVWLERELAPLGEFVPCSGSEEDDRDRSVKTSASVLTTVNAPYGSGLTAEDLSRHIAISLGADAIDAHVFTFFSEVRPSLQLEFLRAHGIDMASALETATRYARLAGYDFPVQEVLSACIDAAPSPEEHGPKFTV